MESDGEAVLPIGLTLESLFSRNGYRAMMGLKRLQPEEYFANRGPVKILQQRSTLLETRSRDFVCEPARRADCDVVLQFVGSFVRANHARTFRELGEVWEPDFVLLRREKSAEIVGGCVCFPTGWSLEEKQDHALSIAHSPVPGLNSQLGPSVERFFGHLKIADCYQRSNWSLTSSKQMNQRPQDGIPEIESDCDPTRTFLRVEWQALASLDERRVIFGIRVYHITLESVCRQREAAQLLAENLRTMPAQMLRYKRLTRCRDRIVELMEG
jgi:dimethylamine monooxygenase subunit A